MATNTQTRVRVTNKDKDTFIRIRTTNKAVLNRLIKAMGKGAVVRQQNAEGKYTIVGGEV